MLFDVNERTETVHLREIVSPFWRFALDERLEMAHEPCQVFRARLQGDAETTSMQVRLRAIPTQAIADRASFVADIEGVARIDHPGIARIAEYGAHNGYDFVAEVWTGESLATALSAYGRIAEKHALLWLRQIAETLDAAHTAGLVHGFLTPHACLVTDDGQARLADFGLRSALTRIAARTYYPLDANGTPVESHALDAHDDQYALAAIAFEIITGRPLPSGDSTSLYRFSARSALAQHLPASTSVVVARALSADPESRYSNCTAFVNALARAAGEPFDAESDGAAESRSNLEPISGAPNAAPQLGLATVLGGLLALLALAGLWLTLSGDGALSERLSRLFSGQLSMNLLGGSVAAPAVERGAGWPIARSDERNSGFARMPVGSVLRLSWQAGVGADGVGGVVLAEGRAVLNRTLDTVAAYDAVVGTPLWSASFGSAIVDTPVLHRGGVLIGLQDGSVAMIDAQNGRTLWTHNALQIRGWPRITARDGVAYVATSEGHVYALDVASGKQLWDLRLPGRDAVTFAPAVGASALFIVSNTPQVMRIDLASRMLLWRQPLAAMPVAAPAIDDKTERLTLLTEDRQAIGLSAATGLPVWSFSLDGSPAGVAVADSQVYVASGSGRLSALDARSGALLWSTKTAGSVGAPPLIDATRAVLATYVGNATEIRYFDRSSGAEDSARAQLIRDRVSTLIAADGWVIARGAALYAYGP
jgi:outer membrane protein assembly factor BamB